MKAAALLSKLFSCPSPPTVCLAAIDVSQYVPLSALAPFEETTNAGAFSRMYRLALFICAWTYSAGLFMARPTGAVCQLLRLWMQKKKGLEGERELFIMKTEHRKMLGPLPPCVPSIWRTNGTAVRPQRSNHRHRRVEKPLSALSGWKAVGLFWRRVRAGWLSLRGPTVAASR